MFNPTTRPNRLHHQVDDIRTLVPRALGLVIGMYKTRLCQAEPQQSSITPASMAAVADADRLVTLGERFTTQIWAVHASSGLRVSSTSDQFGHGGGNR
ncbi:hypothetical protein VTN77DRAFT_8876 [Rasamsonia byssochlamydoides]|uniref:uncharacterized protein n=1 Tax=Rasamsonia byssochlamydoides TaxID=89139 RepID=UPI0037434059